MTLFEFQERSGAEAAYRQHLFEMRRPEGSVCPECGNHSTSSDHGPLQTRIFFSVPQLRSVL